MERMERKKVFCYHNHVYVFSFVVFIHTHALIAILIVTFLLHLRLWQNVFFSTFLRHLKGPRREKGAGRGGAFGKMQFQILIVTQWNVLHSTMSYKKGNKPS